MLNDPLSNVLSTILNSEKIGRESCTISPASTLIKKVLDLLNKEMYIGKYEEVTKEKGGVLKINLMKGV